MKKKSSQVAIIAVIVTSALAFAYLNFCSIPLEMRLEASMDEIEQVRQSGASLGDIKVIQILLDHFLAVLTTR